MSTISSGVFVLHVSSQIFKDLYKHEGVVIKDIIENMLTDVECAQLGLPEQSYDWKRFPHSNLVLKSVPPDKKQSALVSVTSDLKDALLLEDFNEGKSKAHGLHSRNKEQNMVLNALFDEEVKCVTIEGKAGSGKTICALAAALALLQRKKYEKIILSRPMSAVGSPMGALPGTAEEKFRPYLENYFDNFEFLMGKNGMNYLEAMIDKGQIEFKPLKLIGGSSWHNSLVIADEVQSLTPEQFYALTTRPAEGTKIVLMGDSAQRYGKAKDVTTTGLYQWTENVLIHESPIVSYIKLVKQERSALADLAYKVFVDEDG